jgi:hypothetical protein
MGWCSKNDDPLTLSGEVVDQEDMPKAADKDCNPPLRAQVQCHQLQLAVYFCVFELAVQLAVLSRNIGTVNPANPISWRTTILEGITAFELIQQRGGERRRNGRAD